MLWHAMRCDCERRTNALCQPAHIHTHILTHTLISISRIIFRGNIFIDEIWYLIMSCLHARPSVWVPKEDDDTNDNRNRTNFDKKKNFERGKKTNEKITNEKKRENRKRRKRLDGRSFIHSLTCQNGIHSLWTNRRSDTRKIHKFQGKIIVILCRRISFAFAMSFPVGDCVRGRTVCLRYK